MTDNKDAFKFELAEQTPEQKQGVIDAKKRSDEWDRKFEKEEEEKKTNFPKLKLQFTDNLRGMGIKSFRCCYSGSGDEGMMEDVETVPEQYVEHKTPFTKSFEDFDENNKVIKITKYQTVKEYIEEFLCEELLETFHDGWEINEGQNGLLSWDYKTNEIKHDFEYQVPHNEEETF